MNLTGLPSDTTPEAFRVYMSGLRALGGERRAAKIFDAGATLRALSEAGVRRRHPDYTEEHVRLAVLRLRIGNEAFRQAFPGVDLRL